MKPMLLPLAALMALLTGCAAPVASAPTETVQRGYISVATITPRSDIVNFGSSQQIVIADAIPAGIAANSWIQVEDEVIDPTPKRRTYPREEIVIDVPQNCAAPVTVKRTPAKRAIKRAKPRRSAPANCK